MDFSLSENQRKWQLIAREFATKIVAPEALSRDRIPLAKDRIPWDWIKLADEAGIRTLGVPKKFGGAEESILTMCIVGEELAAADLGFAVIMDQCWKMAHLFKDAMTPEQQLKFIPKFVADNQATTAIGITEPDIGSDHQGYYEEQTYTN